LIGQEILASGGSENNQLFYWNRMKKSSSAEVDYVITRKGKIIPIEVKSGAGGRMKSMHQLFLEYPNIKKGLLLSSENHKNPILDKLVFRPLYASFDDL
jgi:predicted AAA+ superfamily ATPase